MEQEQEEDKPERKIPRSSAEIFEDLRKLALRRGG
jgi:hypothetical protein